MFDVIIVFAAGKSSVLLDVKPWDDETDMKKLEEAVRSVQMEGLLWGACMFTLLCSNSICFKAAGLVNVRTSNIYNQGMVLINKLDTKWYGK